MMGLVPVQENEETRAHSLTCEDMERRQQSVNQEQSLHQKSDQAGIWSGALSLQNREK